jgi:signal transduction histidine kinase
VLTTSVILGLVLIYHLAGYPGGAPAFAFFVGLYSIAAYGKSVWSCVVALLFVVVWGVIPALPPTALPWYSFATTGPAIGMAGVIVLGAAAGQVRRSHEQSIAVAEAAAESRMRALLAEERLGIARELHDVLAHTVSVISVQSGVALDSFDDRPEKARQAITQVRALARQAMPELRRTLELLRSNTESPEPPSLVGTSREGSSREGNSREGNFREGNFREESPRVGSSRAERAAEAATSPHSRDEPEVHNALGFPNPSRVGSSRAERRSQIAATPHSRDEPDESDEPDEPDEPDERVRNHPQPGLRQLGDLFTETEAAGLSVHTQLVFPKAALSPFVELTAYRIVQEALTNVIRHAHATAVDVSVRAESEQLTVSVADNGCGASAVDGSSFGLGLLGMRERTQAVGGTLATGDRPTGGFLVQATLPIGSP